MLVFAFNSVAFANGTAQVRFYARVSASKNYYRNTKKNITTYSIPFSIKYNIIKETKKNYRQLEIIAKLKILVCHPACQPA